MGYRARGGRLFGALFAIGGCAVMSSEKRAPVMVPPNVGGAARPAEPAAGRLCGASRDSAHGPPSPESTEIRKTLTRDVIPVGITIQEERRQWEASAATQLPDGITLRDDVVGGVPCVWVEDGATRESGVVLYVHGGGLISGSPRTHAEFASRIVRRLHRRVLLADYRLAPEHPFPAALDDVRAVYAGLLERVEVSDVALGAESSGAGLALALLVDLKKERSLPAAAFFVSGHFDMTSSGMSMASREAVDPVTTRESLERAAAWYTGGADRASPRVSPVFAQLDGLPPLLLQVGDDEILLDDSTRVAAAVRRWGGRADLSVWKGMWHAWPMHADLPEADEALVEIRDFLEHCRSENGLGR
jgi:monoterpene epsilon-lactone hydrolase